jgi:hypothetical protein
MGSISLSSSDFSSFCPSSVYRESLGRSLSSGRPFCPSHPGLPRYPGIVGLRAGATSRRSLFGRGMMLSTIPRRRLPSDRERSRSTTPLIREATTRRCRAGFRRCSQFLSQRPQGFRPRDWETAAANPGGPVSHEAGRLTSLCLCREEKVLRFNTLIKTNKSLSHYINVQIGRI